jgi:hypothetical protein
VFFDRARALQHFVVSPLLDETQARGKLRAWMAGNDTVRGLEDAAAIEAPRLQYFPLWRFVAKGGDGEREFTEPARAMALAGIQSLSVSGGEFRFFSPEQTRDLVLQEPEVQLDSALEWLSRRGVGREEVRETSLVHLPLYGFGYTYAGQPFKAVVDAASGRVLVTDYPRKAEAPFWGAAILTGGFALVLGLIAPNVLVRLILYAMAAVPLFLLSYYVARRH